MSSELSKYAAGDQVPSRRDRDVAKRAKKVRDDTLVTAYEIEAITALAGHAMEEVVDLDNTRRTLAGNDPVLNTMLARIEQTALSQVERTQRGLTNGFGL